MQDAITQGHGIDHSDFLADTLDGDVRSNIQVTIFRIRFTRGEGQHIMPAQVRQDDRISTAAGRAAAKGVVSIGGYDGFTQGTGGNRVIILVRQSSNGDGICYSLLR